MLAIAQNPCQGFVVQNNRILAWVVLSLAAALRFAFPSEYEFKSDEVAMVEMVQQARANGELPWLGMPSSQGFRNPGMSAWPVIVLSFLFGTDAHGLTQGVRALNFLAFLIGVALALGWSGPSRRIWLLGLLLAAVNPIDVVLHRKLWAQSLLPVFSMMTFFLWLRRPPTAWVAFLLGVCIAILPQIHLSGGFVAIPISIAWWIQEKRPRTRGFFLVGALITAWPLVFWAQHLLEAYHSQGSWIRHLLALRNFHLLLSNLSGVVLSYSLGSHFDVFVRQPMVAIAHVGLIGLTLWAVFSVLRARGLRVPTDGGRWGALLLWGVLAPATLMTLAGVYGERHYYLGMFPLPYVAFALALRQSRSERMVFWVAGLQLIVSGGFLWFIHRNGGAPGADFGVLPLPR